MPSAADVFQDVSAALGGLIKRIPDGETGGRLIWILCQGDVLARAQGLARAEVRELQGGYRVQSYRLADGGSVDDIRLGSLGYADWAKESYAAFARLKRDGTIARDVRFQISIPSPLDIVWAFFKRDDLAIYWPVYEAAMAAELDEIVRSIPASELAVQWDMSSEFTGIIEYPERLAQFPMRRLAEAIARLSRRIPSDIELGLHCCYGDPGHKHLIEPTDMANMVAFSRILLEAIPRRVDWIHMPVPKERDDDAYFAPLQILEMPESCELYLGLIHLTDGVDGAKRRIATANKYVRTFGVATECGFGRRNPETIPALLKLHRDIARLAE